MKGSGPPRRIGFGPIPQERRARRLRRRIVFWVSLPLVLAVGTLALLALFDSDEADPGTADEIATPAPPVAPRQTGEHAMTGGLSVTGVVRRPGSGFADGVEGALIEAVPIVAAQRVGFESRPPGGLGPSRVPVEEVVAWRSSGPQPRIAIVAAAGAGRVRLVNEDPQPTLHSLWVGTLEAPVAQAGLPFPGMELTIAGGTPGEVWPVGCRLHEAERAWIVSREAGWIAHSDAEGRFALALGPGPWRLRAWHPEWGEAATEFDIAFPAGVGAGASEIDLDGAGAAIDAGPVEIELTLVPLERPDPGARGAGRRAVPARSPR